MTPFQKIIKYGAILFGFYLVFVILNMIIFGIMTIFGISFGLDVYKSYTNREDSRIVSFDDVFENVNNLDIELSVSKLNVKNGDKFRVEVYNSTNDFFCKMDGDTLKIKDKSSGFNLFNFSENVVPEVVIYIPEEQKFNEVDIETGINETYIEKMSANNVELETGVGKFTIGELKADVAKIVGGAGDTNIKRSTFNDLRLEAGVGKFVINSNIMQVAKIDAGIGQLIVNLEGHKDNYKVKASTGLGSLLVDGVNVNDNQVVGDGNSYIMVEAGVGEVRVNFDISNISDVKKY